VSKLLSRALPPGWTGHTLRHRLATAAYGGTRDLLAVSALLGHSRPETTQRYVRLPDDAIRAAVAAAVLVA
jgi:integrase